MKVLFVATVVETHIMEFHLPYLKMFKDMGWETSVAARNDYANPADCVIPFCDKYYDIPFERNPTKTGNIKAYRQLKTIIDEGDYDIIHCHTPVGGAIGRLAAAKARSKGCKIFYTAHGFHFFRGSSVFNWLLFYPIERCLAHLTDVLITINTEDYNRARRFKAGKIVYVPGIGIDLSKFTRGSKERAKELRAEFGIPENAVVWLSVGEVNKNKNHSIIIDAMSDFDDVWFVLCGRGPLLRDLKKKASIQGVANRTVFAGYRTDVADFYKMADIFVFPSFREGLPVALMEAMASGLKCVASRNRGTNDLLTDSKLRFDPSNLNELKEKLREAMSSDCSDEIQKNKKKLRKYDINNVLSMTRELYLEESRNNKSGKIHE